MLLALPLVWLFNTDPAEAVSYNLTVSCVGDSITWGYPYGGSSSYPSMLLSMLQSNFSGTFNVINHGQPGWTANQLASAVGGWMEEDPDIVLIMAGTNDIYNGQYGVSLAAEIQSIVNVVRSHTNANGNTPIAIVSTIIPTLDSSLTGMTAVTNSDILNYVSADSKINTNWTDFYNGAAGIAYSSLMNDTLHPNTAGYGAMAQNFYDAVVQFQSSWPVVCTYTVVPVGSTSFDDAGRYGHVTVTTNQSECSWTAVSRSSWIGLYTSGTGSATVAYWVDANTDEDERTGTILVAGTTVTVTQAGLFPWEVFLPATMGP